MCLYMNTIYMIYAGLDWRRINCGIQKVILKNASCHPISKILTISVFQKKKKKKKSCQI
ncbi:unnamed protein product [Arabidopsis halleri]